MWSLGPVPLHPSSCVTLSLALLIYCWCVRDNTMSGTAAKLYETKSNALILGMIL